MVCLNPKQAARARAAEPSAISTERQTDTSSPMLEAARTAARAGLSVLPNLPATKHPHVKRWPDLATDNLRRIERWWAKWPDANPGIACGPSGLVVLDEDEPGEVIRAFEQEGWDLPDTFKVATGREGGGTHYWFRQPQGDPIHNTGWFVARGYKVDVRGQGGQVIAPGGLHRTGAIYEALNDLPPADLPEEVARALRTKEHLRRTAAPRATDNAADFDEDEEVAPEGARAALDAIAQDIISEPEGGRNNLLNAKAYRLGRYVAGGLLDEAEVANRLADAAQVAGLDPDEIDPTLQSGIDDGKAHPRKAAAAELSPDRYEQEVIYRLRRLQIDEDARQRLAAAKAREVELPALVSLDQLLAESDEPIEWLVEGLWVRDGKALMAAPAKSGKTTTVGNLVRSLVDGVPFLDAFETDADLAGRVYLADFEMSRAQLRTWYRTWKMRHDERVSVDALRGMAGSMDLRVKEVRRRWVQRIAGHDTAIFDPIAPILAGLGIDENKNEVGTFLEALDETMHDAGVSQYLVIHHTGHEDERARGHSGLLGWGDANWNLRKDKSANPTDDEFGADAPRFFSANGRDVAVREALLDFDPVTLTLTFQAAQGRAVVRADRDAAKQRALVVAIVQIVADQPGIGASDLDKALKARGFSWDNKDASANRQAAIDAGYVRNVGTGNRKSYRLTDKGKRWVSSRDGQQGRLALDDEGDDF